MKLGIPCSRKIDYGVTTCVVVWIEIVTRLAHMSAICVTTCVVVWIEIFGDTDSISSFDVTTCVVVWIEIIINRANMLYPASPPAWWCGLKYRSFPGVLHSLSVTTCVVVWIEIFSSSLMVRYKCVTTCVVVWIEIDDHLL